MSEPLTDDTDDAQAFYHSMVRELEKYSSDKAYFNEPNIVRRALMMRNGFYHKLPIIKDLPSIEFIPFEKKAQRMYCDICGQEDDENHNDKACTLDKLDAMKMLALERDFLDVAKKIATFQMELEKDE